MRLFAFLMTIRWLELLPLLLLIIKAQKSKLGEKDGEEEAQNKWKKQHNIEKSVQKRDRVI